MFVYVHVGDRGKERTGGVHVHVHVHAHADAEVGECLYWHSCMGPNTAAYVSVDRHPLARAK